MTLTHDEPIELLGRLLADPENEVVEFKEAAPQFSPDKTSEYVSALNKEVNQLGFASGWLGCGVSNVSFLRGQPHAGRGDVEGLPRSALGQAIAEQQKTTNITNLLKNLRRRGVIVNRGTRPTPRGELIFAGDEGAQFEPHRTRDVDISETARGPGPA